jgi:putative nucleotidyltransferase with HDIG domain
MARQPTSPHAPPPAGGPSPGKSRTSRLEPVPPIRARRWAFLTWQVSELWRKTLEMPGLWVALFLILGTWVLMPGVFLFLPEVAPGAIAERDYVANRDLLLPDAGATEVQQDLAREEVRPVYDFDSAATPDREARIARLFTLGRRVLRGQEAAPEEAAREILAGVSAAGPAGATAGQAHASLTLEQAELLVRRRFSPELEERIHGLQRRVLRRGVVANKNQLLENRLQGISLRTLGGDSPERLELDLFNYLGYPDEVRELLDSEVGDWEGYSAAERQVLVSFLLANLGPNLHPNRSETLARREAAAAEVGQVFSRVRSGQTIARKGDVIDDGQARVIANMRGDRRLRDRVPPIVGTLCLLSLTAVVVWFGFARERVAHHSRRRVFAESLLLLLVSLLCAKLCFLVAGALGNAFEMAPFNSALSYAYAIPFASLALVAALLLGRNSALVLSLLFSLLSSRLTAGGDGLWVIFYGFAGSLAAIYALDYYKFGQRLVTARVGLVVGLFNLVMVLILTSFAPPGERGLLQVGFDLLCAFAGGLLVAVVASFAIPVLEALLSITTDIKLLELSNTNLPLLRHLAFKAPGTFQHSLMVANLAKEGCEAIGADPVLAYAGGLYHDIGKALRPDYFIENQRPGENPHDKLLPSMSALILVNHVKDGVEIAREQGLPQVIVDAIEQHHGTRLMKFFFSRAQERRDPDASDITEERYRYPGPKPQSKVMGVLMLADAVEAASRTLTEPSPVKIRGLIRTIFEDCLGDGQLDHTDLTLSDLRNVADSFQRILATIFHQRVDYPGFDFNAGVKRERRGAIRRVS